MRTVRPGRRAKRERQAKALVRWEEDRASSILSNHKDAPKWIFYAQQQIDNLKRNLGM